MSLKPILASMTLCVFLTSFCLAEGTASGPGKSIPLDAVTTAEEPLVLDSAPAEPVVVPTLSDIIVTPTADSAEMTFSTNTSTYATIEYGRTTEYENALNTETMMEYMETIAGLSACQTYQYRVHVVDADDATLDASSLGTFTTKGCVVKKSIPAPTPVVQPSVAPIIEISATPESEMLALPLESEISLNAAPSEEEVNGDTLEALPDSPRAPILVSEPIEAPENRATQNALALLGLLLLVGGLIVVRRKSK